MCETASCVRNGRCHDPGRGLPTGSSVEVKLVGRRHLSLSTSLALTPPFVAGWHMARISSGGIGAATDGLRTVRIVGSAPHPWERKLRPRNAQSCGNRRVLSRRARHRRSISPRGLGRIESATPGLGTGAQLEEAASEWRDLSTTLRQGSKRQRSVASAARSGCRRPPCTEISYEFRRKRL